MLLIIDLKPTAYLNYCNLFLSGNMETAVVALFSRLHQPLVDRFI